MKTLTRRSFLTELAAGAILAPWVTSGLRAQSPNSIVHHGTFGCSGMAMQDVSNISGHKAVKVVAACDVDARKVPEFSKKFPDARIYTDFRELLEKEKDLQSVNVSTPDHMHAPIGMTALQRGLHVYGQKPLTHDIYECRRLAEVAREKKRITQMGIQIHSESAYRTAVAVIQGGVVGKVREVHTWSSKKWGDNGKMPTETEAPPKDLDWNLWLGVCAERPFIDGFTPLDADGKPQLDSKGKPRREGGFYHPGNWRKRLDFGTGTFGDMGCHIYDPVFKALALTAPLSVRSDGAAPNNHSWATDAIITYVFPGTPFSADKTVKVVWYDGDQRPPKDVQDAAGIVDGDKKLGLPDQGSIFLGTDGVAVLPHISHPRLAGAAKERKFDHVPGDNHWHQFIEAVIGNRKNGDANFDYAGPLTESVLLGSVASRFPKKTLEWDAAALRFTNANDANAFVKRAYRKGWNIAGL